MADIDLSDVPGDLRRPVGAALHAAGVSDGHIGMQIVGEGRMRTLNYAARGVDEATDVLAFPIDDDVVEMGRWPDASTTGPDRAPVEPDDAPLLLGDVVICPAVAAHNAPAHAGTYDDEVALLLVHGILHVLGHDHAEAEETRVMQERERDLLRRFHRDEP